MDVKELAKEFAIRAHKGQVRKSDKVKPMIIHPINVANILSEYGFDDNVIAAGYLHDVVEDTKYELSDITDKFGSDIASLVKEASEPDKSLPWEERKEYTIENTKSLDIRHKALIGADKISNLEDLKILCELEGKEVFNRFNRGFVKSKWYYTSIYESLIYNSDSSLPMFKRLKGLIDHVFNDIKNDYIDDSLFSDKKQYSDLLRLNYMNKEIKKMKSLINEISPFVIEFSGTPRTGKTSLMNNLKDFFKKEGFKVLDVCEFFSSKKYKEDIYPEIKDKGKKYINKKILELSKDELLKFKDTSYDIILFDRSLSDRLIWIDRLFKQGDLDEGEYIDIFNKYVSIAKENINMVIFTYCSYDVSLKRDYNTFLSLVKRNFLNKENIDSYNESLMVIKDKLLDNDTNVNFIDTTDKSEREVAVYSCHKILESIKKYYLEEMYKEFN